MMFVDVRGKIRRFAPGDYTLMHDASAGVQHATLDLLLHVCSATPPEAHGGQTVYVVRRRKKMKGGKKGVEMGRAASRQTDRDKQAKDRTETRGYSEKNSEKHKGREERASRQRKTATNETHKDAQRRRHRLNRYSQRVRVTYVGVYTYDLTAVSHHFLHQADKEDLVTSQPEPNTLSLVYREEGVRDRLATGLYRHKQPDTVFQPTRHLLTKLASPVL